MIHDGREFFFVSHARQLLRFVLKNRKLKRDSLPQRKKKRFNAMRNNERFRFSLFAATVDSYKHTSQVKQLEDFML